MVRTRSSVAKETAPDSALARSTPGKKRSAATREAALQVGNEKLRKKIEDLEEQLIDTNDHLEEAKDWCVEQKRLVEQDRDMYRSNFRHWKYMCGKANELLQITLAHADRAEKAAEAALVRAQKAEDALRFAPGSPGTPSYPPA